MTGPRRGHLGIGRRHDGDERGTGPVGDEAFDLIRGLLF